VRRARRFVRTHVLERCSQPVADDATVVAGELLANADQHGLPPVSVHVLVDASKVRIEVRDASPRVPVRGIANSTSNMTGRGFTLIESLTQRWGVQRTSGGKTVWAELSTSDSVQWAPYEQPGEGLATWTDEPPDAQQRYPVVLGDVPTDLLLGAKAHIDNLVREFTLATASNGGEAAALPEQLAHVIETVVHGFGEARIAIKRQAMRAAERHEPRTQLVLHLPLTAADAGEAYLAALDAADNYARAGRLLTLETPADHRLFRHWYVEAVVAQLRQVARGQAPTAVERFEDRVLREIRTLSVAQRASERTARLQRVSAALARARTPEDVAQVVVSEGVAVLRASGGSLLIPASDGEHLGVPGTIGYSEQLVGLLREERLDAQLPAATALRTGRPIWLESREEGEVAFPALIEFESTAVAICAVPLVVGARTIGALRFSFDADKLFDDEERQFVLDLAAHTAQTLQRTEAYQAERRMALDLQREFLPKRAPEIAGWDTAAYYRPAGGHQLGGDFYDVLPAPGGCYAAIVGDVMGRGTQAAAAMAQVRSVIRAYVIDDPEPEAVFRRVAAYFDALDAVQLVTALYFLVEPASETVLMANAGHLPPLLIRPDGGSVVVGPVGLPFGVGRDDPAVTKLAVPTGSALVAVTDGLVERRHEDIDVGIARVLSAATHGTFRDARSLLARIVAEGLAQGTQDDDVTALVLHHL